MELTYALERQYLSSPELTGEEFEYVKLVLEEGWIGPGGSMVDRFESEFARAVGIDNAIALNSGTAALHVALHLSGVGPGDKVVCSTFTYIASANPIRYLGAEVIFVDVDESWHIDPVILEEVLDNESPKAVILPHIYGQSADLKSIVSLCRSRGVILVEDAAEGLGATYDGRSLGTFGDFGAFSFNANKLITTSGGGMLVFKDASLGERARLLIAQSKEIGPGFDHKEIGYNYRLSNILAAVGCAQLKCLDERVIHRRKIFDCYKEGFAGIAGVQFMPEHLGCVGARWLTCLFLDSTVREMEVCDIIARLCAKGIEARHLWTPLHSLRPYKGCKYYGGCLAEELSKNGLCLPSSGILQPEIQDVVMDELKSLLL